MGLFKKTKREMLTDKLDKLMDNSNKKGIKENPERYVVISMEQDLSMAFVVDKESTTPKDLADAGKKLSEKFDEEVAIVTGKQIGRAHV